MSTLTEAYGAAINSMDGVSPRPLQPLAAFLAAGTQGGTADVSLDALCIHIRQVGSDDDLLRRQLHLAIAGWDAITKAPWSAMTQRHTVDRRSLIYQLLELDEPTRFVLDSEFPRVDDGPLVISRDFEPWYDQNRRTEHDFYWRAYKEHLLAIGFSTDGIAALSAATDSVVERLSDPTRDVPFQAKGLVVGYVQSGKTANFTGVIAKAIDAGYRLIIVLTGTVDLLRKQTQRRLDMELVGVENIFLGVDPADDEQARDIDYYDDEDLRTGKFVTHGFQPAERGLPNIVRLTGHNADYRNLNTGITALEMEKRHPQKPLYHPDNLYVCGARLAVVKKNGAVLKHLVEDLNRIRLKLGQIPTLIIDDESDEASVNTTDPKTWLNGEVKRTVINGHITRLLKLLPRAQYVGYTATPYANVFIDPNEPENLFPKDFVISLGRSAGYMGVSDFHDLDWSGQHTKTIQNSNQRAFVRDLRAMGDGTAAEEEAEIRQALDAFVLSGAIKLLREHLGAGSTRFRHHTMLMHESVRMSKASELRGVVRKVWDRGAYLEPSGMERLARLLNDDFYPVNAAKAPELLMPDRFEDLKPYIAEAFNRIAVSDGNPVLVVNGDKDIVQEKLDFETRPVWRILVGGAKLSRGFTVEGLTVSYFRRATNNASALMQMGRWFGFRQGYNDLIRLYIARGPADGHGVDLYEAFEAIVRDEEDFRRELRRYAVMVNGRPQITPRDIPPLVSQRLPSVKPAAKNKMFNAEVVIRRSPGIPVEPVAYPADSQARAENYKAMLPILRASSLRRQLEYPSRTTEAGAAVPAGSFPSLVGDVTAAELFNAVVCLKWLTPGAFGPDLAYLREITGTSVDSWTIIAPQLRDSRMLPELDRRSVIQRDPRGRGTGQLYGAISEPDHRAPAASIAAGGVAAGDTEVRPVGQRRGAVLIYPVVAKGFQGDPRPEDLVVAFVLFAPTSAASEDGRVIRFRVRDTSRADDAIIDGK